jgi:serine protease Do
MPQLCSRPDVRAIGLWPALLAVAILPAVSSSSELRNSPIVKAVLDNETAVVNIHGRKTVPATNASYSGGEPSRQVNGMGTGVIIDPRGYILTNYHVVEGVSNIQVSLSDNKNTTARLIADRHTPRHLVRSYER